MDTVDELKRKLGRNSSLIGVVFGYLTPLEVISRTSNGTKIYKCQCKCGSYTEANSNILKVGDKQSCGCIRVENNGQRTHGMSKTRIFKSWILMRERCYNPKNNRYYRYGGRGIKVCKEWESFEKFYADMKDGYADNLTLDRKRVNEDYSKENCRWATKQEQSENKSTTVYLTINGETKTVKEWSKLSGVNSNNIRSRIKKGNWSAIDAVFKPLRYV